MATKISFSGKNLDRVRDALADAISWHKNEIGHLTRDVDPEGEDEDYHESEIAQLEAMLTKIDRKLGISP